MYRRLIFAFAMVFASVTTTFAADSTQNWQKSIEAWRAQHEAEIKSPDGWLTVVGLEWLRAGINTVGSAADSSARIDDLGQNSLLSIRYEASRILLEAPKSGFPAGLTLNGEPAKPSELSYEGPHPSVLRYGSFTLTVIHRGNGFAIRVKNAKSASLEHFSGLRWYSPDPVYRVTARWVPYAEPKKVTIQSVVDTTSTGIVPGEAHFELNGKTIVLLPVLQSMQDKALFFVLRDETSKTTTYQASRFLHTALPDHGLSQPGSVLLDFNQLVNPPCAFTSYATCPLPQEQNKLAIALPVGELRYDHE